MRKLQTITGRLGKNPVLYHRNTKKGHFPVTKFSLAVETFENGQNKTVWFQVDAWKKRAELCAKNLRKGDAVQLHGFASIQSFQGKNGLVSYPHFEAVYITFLGKAKANIQQTVAGQAVETAAQPSLSGVSQVNPF